MRCSRATWYRVRQRPSTSSHARSWAGVGRSFSLEVLRTVSISTPRLRINVALDRLLAHVARCAGEIAAGPRGRQFEQVRELCTEMKGRDALALLHHLRRAIAGPHPHEQVDVVWLDRQRQNLPTLFRALALDQVAAGCGHWPHQHWLAAARAPDEVIDDQVDAMLIPLVLVCLFHVASIPQYRPAYKGRVLSAKAWKRLTARVETRRLAAGPNPPPRAPPGNLGAGGPGSPRGGPPRRPPPRPRAPACRGWSPPRAPGCRPRGG